MRDVQGLRRHPDVPYEHDGNNVPQLDALQYELYHLRDSNIVSELIPL